MPRTKSVVPIAFDDRGRGEPTLLCLPGWCAERSAFADLLRKCSRTRRTLALDWRGHGQSGSAAGDFGETALIEDAVAVIERSGAQQVVPVALAHAGWVATELRRRLGERIPAIVLVDWLVLDPPPPFIAALAALQDADNWQSTRDQLFDMWLQGVDNRKVIHLVREVMGSYGYEMWARAGRAIAAAYRREGNPLKALAGLRPAVPVLHLYAQPADPGFLRAQQEFAAANPWFKVRKLDARSHFPMLEIPAEVADAIEAFIAEHPRALGASAGSGAARLDSRSPEFPPADPATAPAPGSGHMLWQIMSELPLADVAAGVAHYRDVLGFKVNYQQHDLGVMDRDSVRVLLIAKTPRHQGIGSCYVYVQDADALHAELLAKGAGVQDSPVSRPWGLREFHVLDPEGNRITFGQPFE